MRNIRWYYYRLKKMNVLEIIHRMKVFLFEKNIKNKKIAKDKLQFIKNIEMSSDLLGENICYSANEYMNNKYLMFNQYINLNIEEKNKYLINPLNNDISPIMFFQNININDIDPKPIWEFNKHYQLLSLALEYKKTKERVYLNKILKEINLWISQNKPYYSINWTSNLEMAIRNINWLLILEIIIDDLDKDQKDTILQIIHLQVDFIYNRLSLYSSSNNHLIGELTFLLLASKKIIFKGNSKIFTKVKKILEKQITNQFYDDGVNKEQSINYQLHTTEFYLISMKFLRDNGDKFSSRVEDYIKKSLLYIHDISEKNGEFFNIGDQDSGNIIKISNKGNEVLDILHLGSIYFKNKKFIYGKDEYVSDKAILFYGNEYLDMLGTNINENILIDSLYKLGGVRIKEKIIKNNILKLYFDFGEIGMKPLYAHAHSDILSFNLSVNGKFIFNDMGTYKYKTEDGWRDYFRGVYAHNTIAINEKNQFEFLGPFICDKSPYTILTENGENVIEAKSEAYKKEKCILTRRIEFDIFGIKINDRIKIEELNYKNIDIIFNFDKDVKLTKLSSNKFLIESNGIKLNFYIDERLAISNFYGFNLDVKRGYQSKSFGEICETNQIIASCKTNSNISLCHRIEVV